jgi:hypothetical protein
MKLRYSAALLLAAVLLTGGKKHPVSARGENEDLILNATLYLDPADIRELVGSDLGGHYIVAEVKVEPKYTKDIALDRDDFELRTDKDGEKAHPWSGSQVAGSGGLVLRETKPEMASPGWSGVGGPMIVGGGGGGIGNSSGPTSVTAAKQEKDDKPNPLKKALDEKILPEGKTTQPVSGLLYFPMEKQKLKDLSLLYGGKENRITLRFK